LSNPINVADLKHSPLFHWQHRGQQRHFIHQRYFKE
jgi:hypothetical protein